MIYNTKIISKRIERGMKPNVEYRVKNKLHCAGGVETCSHQGCDIYGLVSDDGRLFCFRHYKEKFMSATYSSETEIIEPKANSLFKRRPSPGSPEY
jgi:hypothetical protein